VTTVAGNGKAQMRTADRGVRAARWSASRDRQTVDRHYDVIAHCNDLLDLIARFLIEGVEEVVHPVAHASRTVIGLLWDSRADVLPAHVRCNQALKHLAR